MVAKSPSPVAPFEDASMLRTNNSRLCPHEIVRSPGGSPNRRGKTKVCQMKIRYITLKKIM